MKRILLLCCTIGLLAGCGAKTPETHTTDAEVVQKTFQWKLVTSWPKNFPGLGTGPEYFARQVDAMSAGRLKIHVSWSPHWKCLMRFLTALLKWAIAVRTSGKAKCLHRYFLHPCRLG